jgi:hypothetical protein
MADDSAGTTGNDALSGVDPGGTRSTKPGNPDKSGVTKPDAVKAEHHVVSGDRNDGRLEEFSKMPP